VDEGPHILAVVVLKMGDDDLISRGRARRVGQLSLKRAFTLFLVGTLGGLVALGFNFLFRLGGIAAFPPESGLSAFLRVIPASIEEPMVQQFGDFAGQLGLVLATVVAGAVYGIALVVFDRFGARRAMSAGLSRLEVLLVLGLVPWLVFGLVLFPLDGDAVFGISSPFASSAETWAFPFTLLLVQGIFAWVVSLRYRPRVDIGMPAGPVQLPDRRRREFIEKGTVGVLAAVGALVGLGGVGQLFPSAPQATGGSQPIDLQDAPAIFRDPRLAKLVDSEVTPNQDFYRVAIDIIDPVVGVSNWSLMVDGLVNGPKAYLLQDIQSFPEVIQYTTLECVSNNVNGNLISNAKWGGAKISDVLANAGGVQAGANYVVFYSVDGYSVGIPLSKAMMPDSLLAYSMNDVALPVKNGYPLRALIPGLYGMMSAKWINRVSVVGSTFDGYWQTRGWTNNAAVYTEAFIVIPSASSVSISQNGGSIIVAGYAFAGDRGVSKVEVSFDNGKTWQQAELKTPISNETWALWAYEWTPDSAGSYKIVARATDGTGQVQTSAATGTFPNGATGYASALVEVTD
jgi:DMSO/TMAO reductase YedYZ molybdopterin-dependent catalytic subunit